MRLPPKPKNTLISIACAALLAASGFIFSERSLRNIAEVDARLQKVATCALEYSTVDFVVIDGYRTPEEHEQNVHKGISWTARSKHQDGLAIDIAAYQQGKIVYTPVLYYQISAAFYYCANKLKTPIIWGGEWRVQDLMHYELKGRP